MEIDAILLRLPQNWQMPKRIGEPRLKAIIEGSTCGATHVRIAGDEDCDIFRNAGDGEVSFVGRSPSHGTVRWRQTLT